MRASKSQFQAFISHASHDMDKANTLVTLLERARLRCWIAPRDIRDGVDYGAEIISGLEKSSHLFLLLSRASNKSSFVAREVERAVSKNKSIICVRLQDVQPSRRLEFFVSTTQWIDGWRCDDETLSQRLLEAVTGQQNSAQSTRSGLRDDGPVKNVWRNLVTFARKGLRFSRRLQLRTASIPERLASRRYMNGTSGYPRSLTLNPLTHGKAAPVTASAKKLVGGGVVVGRGKDSDVMIQDVSISRRHAKLYWRDGRYYLLDLDSMNGSTINGRRLRRQMPVKLRAQDILQFGRVRYRVR
ncbi:MAG: FHA domain-containing protein [Pseudomonadota bacterium]